MHVTRISFSSWVKYITSIKSHYQKSSIKPNPDQANSILQYDITLAVPNLPLGIEMPVVIQPTDVDRIVSILARHAASSFTGSRSFFRDLVDRANLPEDWKQSIDDVWTGNANLDARKLVKWSITKGTNRNDRKYTTLGSILSVLLRDEVGLDDASSIVALILVYQLYLDKRQLENLAIRYQVPLVFPPSKGPSDIGPPIIWWGPTNNLQLQGFLRPDPPVLDVGFLTRAIQRAASVCRVEIPQKNRQGTGFLIATDLLLTNYHVLKMHDGEDIGKNARNTMVRFGCITAANGIETEGQSFKLTASNPILRASPPDKLDYVLLQVEESILQAKGLLPAPYDLRLPTERMGMHILQQPEGGVMKLAITSNGITGVYRNRGLIQYVTKASTGSSGAPCFNDDWKVVALHHAEQSKNFGSIREGILFISIFEEIKGHL